MNPFPLALDKFGSTRLFYFEETNSVVQVTLERDKSSASPQTEQIFDIYKYYIQELILHALLAEETHNFALPDGLVILNSDSEEGLPDWSLKVSRAPWKLGENFDFYHVPRTNGERGGGMGLGARKEPLGVWREKFTFFFGVEEK